MSEQDYTLPTTERAAVLRVAKQMMEHLVPEISFEDATTQRFLRQSGAFKKLHDALRLPDSCVIHFIYAEKPWNMWGVFIESPDFPVANTEPEWPKLDGLWKREGDTVVLCRLNIGNTVVWQRDDEL